MQQLRRPGLTSALMFVLQVVSIVGKEVFSLVLSLTPRATEGSAYADTSRSDGRVKLSVSCIQVVYLHKVFMSLLVSWWTNQSLLTMTSCF